MEYHHTIRNRRKKSERNKVQTEEHQAQLIPGQVDLQQHKIENQTGGFRITLFKTVC